MTICDCLILFALHIVGKVRYNWIGVRAVELNTANALNYSKKLVYSYFILVLNSVIWG